MSSAKCLLVRQKIPPNVQNEGRVGRVSFSAEYHWKDPFEGYFQRSRKYGWIRYLRKWNIDQKLRKYLKTIALNYLTCKDYCFCVQVPKRSPSCCDNPSFTNATNARWRLLLLIIQNSQNALWGEWHKPTLDQSFSRALPAPDLKRFTLQKKKNWFSNFSKSRVTSGCGAISQNIIAILGLVIKAVRADFFVFNATDRS